MATRHPLRRDLFQVPASAHLGQSVRLGRRIPQRGHEQGRLVVLPRRVFGKGIPAPVSATGTESYLKEAADWPKEKFAERMAHYQCELIALHPFYELNGRITRLFFDLIAMYNGYGPVDYSQTLGEAADESNAYIQASIACVRAADNSMLRQIILDGLNKAEAP
ncbi:MAG: Fic family protein [Thiobacillus sp.]